jgi:hypothetical protein
LTILDIETWQEGYPGNDEEEKEKVEKKPVVMLANDHIQLIPTAELLSGTVKSFSFAKK